MAKETISSVDVAWLHMEDPTNLMMVTGIMVLENPLNMDHLMAIIEHRWLRYERFRQRVVDPTLSLSRPQWETDPNFDLDAHIHHIALPDPGDQETLQELVGDLMSTPLDYSKPLWHFHVIENYIDGWVILARLHHCLADGIALMQVLLSMTDISPDAPWPKPLKPAAHKKSGGGLLRRTIGRVVRPTAAAVSTARHVTGRVVHGSLETIFNPGRLSELAQQGSSAALATSRLLLLPPDPPTPFKGKLGVAKMAAWSHSLPLKEVKVIKNVLGGTVNDVLISAVAGGLRRYLLEHGEWVDDVNIRAIVPVNIRKEDEIGELGNKFGLVFLSLPLGIEDPLERLVEIRRRMDALKGTPEAVVAFGILGAIGLTPTEVQNVIVKIFGMKGTAVMTNVPGPQLPLYLAGSEIKDMMFWVPQSGRLGMGVSIISYNGRVYLGVVTDEGLVPDPDEIIKGFYKEYDAFLELVDQEKEIKTGETAVVETPPEPETPDRCQGKTKSGNQCKKKAQPGSDYCYIHQKTAVPA